MPTNYPANLDNFTNPIASDKLDNPSHSSQHTNENDAIEAIEGYLGTTTSTGNSTITGRVKALEAGGSGGTVTSVGATAPVTSTGGSAPVIGMPVATGSVNGYLSAANFNTFSNKQNPATTLAGYGITNAYTKTESDANYVNAAGDTMTGALLFADLVTGGTASIDVKLDPLSSIGAALVIDAPEGSVITSPYTLFDTNNLQTTMMGAQVGSLLSVAAIDAFGVVSFGYAQPLPLAYSVQDEATADVIIKATNDPINPAWVDLGLAVTLTEDIPASFGNASFEMLLSNPTTRSGSMEYAVRVNGVVSTNTIVFQIPANYLQTTATSVPLVNSYVTGDIIELVARVISNSNDQFSLLMDATPDIAIFRMWAVGASSGGGGGVETVGATAPVTSTGGINPVIAMPAASAGVDGYLSSANYNLFNGKQSPATTLAGYGITNAYTKTESDANYPSKSGSGASGSWGISITGNANTATTALGVDDLNSVGIVKQWIGTVAQYEELGSYDPYTYYALKDGQTAGGGGGTSVSWDDVTNKPSTYPPSSHTHPISEVVNLQTSLNNKLDATAAAASVVDQGAGASLKVWYGTESQYSAIPTKDSTTVYFRSA